MHRLQELVRLHRMGLGPRAVARHLRMGPNTERQYREALMAAGLLTGSPENLPDPTELKAALDMHAPPKPAPQQVSSIAEWQPTIEQMWKKGLGPKAILDRLRLEEAEFTGKLGAIKRMVRRLDRDRGPQAKDVAIPVDTVAGEVAQVDFGFGGWRWDPDTGRNRRSWVFVMVLGYSRHMYAETVFDQRAQTWLALHERAFFAFGGVPRTIVPDNLKAAVIRAAFGVSDQVELNRSYRELARHYGFKIDPTPPYAPQKKGKVESGVKYVKGNCLKGRDGETLEQVNRALTKWVRDIAGTRSHGTTGKQPLAEFEAVERATLLPLPTKRYDPVLWKKATVHRDSHVLYDRRMYSVPWTFIGRELWVRATAPTITIHAHDERVATHRRRSGGPRSTQDGHLPPGRAALRHRSRDYWQERADKIGDEVGVFIREVFDSDDVLLQLRQVQAIVTHLEKFPPARARAACHRASFYGATSYQAIKNILCKALDLEPLPTSKLPVAWADAPRFARDPADLLAVRAHGI